jgi:Sulfotransferase domain
MPMRDAPRPTFLIIGAQKSATRWLRQNLGLHPSVFTAEFELAFFNQRRYDRLGTDWYRAQFDGWSGEPFVGEATPGYMIWHHAPGDVARRVADTVPDAKLIAILRNPVDRANSALVHHKRRERIRPNARLLDVARSQPPEEDRFALISGGWYAASLQPYQALFGEQLLVLLHDDVRDDPASVYERALQHVGASNGFVPPSLRDIVFSNQDSARLRHEVTPEERIELYEYFRDDIRKLERMFDLDLTIWGPDQPGASGAIACSSSSQLDSSHTAKAESKESRT